MSMDPVHERQVETIRNLVDSYMRIVHKTTRDMVPKTIMHMVVSDLKTFCAADLLAHVYSADQHELMEESPEEAQRREDLLKMYAATRDALKIISDVGAGNYTAPAPAPAPTQTYSDYGGYDNRSVSPAPGRVPPSVNRAPPRVPPQPGRPAPSLPSRPVPTPSVPDRPGGMAPPLQPAPVPR